mgnify:FL=1
MKKTLKSLVIALIAGVMAVSAVACSGTEKDKENKDNSSVATKKFEDIKIEASDDRDAPLGETIIKEVEDGEKDIEALKAVAKSEDLMIGFDLEQLGMEAMLAKKGENVYAKTSMFGITATMLALDGQVYLINDENKVYCKGTENDMAGFTAEELALDGAWDGELLGAWDVEIDGGTFRRLKVKASDGSTNFMYLYDDELKYVIGFMDEDEVIESEEQTDVTDEETEESAVMLVTAYRTTDIDESYFQLPADYKEVTADEYYELMYGDLGMDFEDETLDDTDIEVDDDIVE